MNKSERLKNSILQMAMEGKLVPQDDNDEPASVLIEKIKKEKEKLIKDKKIKRNKKESIIYKENGSYYEKIGKEIKCIDDEIPFEIPETWEFTKLGNIISISSGDSLTLKNMNKNGTIPVYGGNGVTGFHDKYNINKKTLIIGRVGFYCGNTHISEKKAWITDNAFITTFPEEYINFNFLKLLITFSNLKKYSSSTAQPVISGKKIYPILIPIPPLEEQKRIVEKIEEVLPLVEKYGKLIDELEYTYINEFPEKLRKSILQEAIQGKLSIQESEDEPASVLIEKIKKEKEKLIKDKKIKRNKKESIIYKENGSYYEKIGKEIKCIDDEIPFEIPETWEWARISSIYTNKGQKKPNKPFYYVDVATIDNKLNKILEPKKLDSNEAPSRARKILQKGNLIYSSVRPYLNNIAILDKDFSDEVICSTAFFVMSFYIIDTKFMMYLLLSPYFYGLVSNNMKGVAYPAINNKEFNNFILPIPPLKEQKRIVEKIEEVLPLISKDF